MTPNILRDLDWFRPGDERGYDCQSTPGSCDAVCPQVPQESRYDSRLSSWHNPKNTVIDG